MLKSMDLSWIVVSNLKQARSFFVEKLGLKEVSYSEEHSWLELAGQEGGALLGVAEANAQMAAGKNAIITFTVADLDKTISLLKKNQITLIGEVIVVPGHVKMQMFTDLDGNQFQAIQMLEEHPKA